MRIKPRAKQKPINKKSYYSWMVVEKPKGYKRLPQLNKFFRRLHRMVGDSELVAISKKMELRYA